MSDFLCSTRKFLQRIHWMFNCINGLVYQLIPRQSRLISAVLWMRYKWDVNSYRLTGLITRHMKIWISSALLSDYNKKRKMSKTMCLVFFFVVVLFLFSSLCLTLRRDIRAESKSIDLFSAFFQRMRHTCCGSQYLKTKGKGFFATLTMQGPV